MLFLVSVSPTCSSIVSCQCNKTKPTTSTTPQMSKLSLSSQTSVQSIRENSVPVVALGALLAFSVMLLTVVTIGWVCTCINVKNKLAINRSHR